MTKILIRLSVILFICLISCNPDKTIITGSKSQDVQTPEIKSPEVITEASPKNIDNINNNEALPEKIDNVNKNPIIKTFTVSPNKTLVNGDTVTLNINAVDPNDRQLDYTWSATDGVLSATKGLDVKWMPPTTPGAYSISVLVTNDLGGSTAGSQNVVVNEANPDVDSVVEKEATLDDSWLSPIQISRAGSVANYPQILLDAKGYYHVIWLGKIGTKKDLNYIFTSNSGKSWSTPNTITTMQGSASVPAAAIDNNGTLHLVWADEKVDGGIYYSSTSDFKIWSTPVQIAPTTLSYSFPNTYVDIFVDNRNKIHTVWNDSNINGDTVYYSSSTDNGITWKNPIKISPDNLSCWFPQVTSGGNQFFISFIATDNEISDTLYVAGSNEEGTALNPPVKVYFSPRKSGTDYPDLSSLNDHSIMIDAKGTLHLLWSNAQYKKKLLYSSSTDKGQTWINPQTLFEYKCDRLEHSCLKIKEDKIVTVFQVVFTQIISDKTVFGGTLYNIESENSGQKWNVPKPVYRNYSSPGINPDIELTNTNDILMVMEKENQVFFMKGK